jgi:hypothetical protein
MENDISYSIKHSKQGFGKHFVAIIIGIVVGIIFRFLIGIPLIFLFYKHDGLPQDIESMLEYVSAFIAGALAGSLLVRNGWLIGGLTQFFKLLLLGIILVATLYISFTETEKDFSVYSILSSYFTRLIIIAIIIAGIGGHIGQKYRNQIWKFMSSVFTVIGGLYGFLIYILSGVIGLYLLYLGGKAIFEERAILKGIMIICILSPLVSSLAFGLFMGIITAGTWLFEKLSRWYKSDLISEIVD